MTSVKRMRRYLIRAVLKSDKDEAWRLQAISQIEGWSPAKLKKMYREAKRQIWKGVKEARTKLKRAREEGKL